MSQLQGTQWTFADYDYLYKHYNTDGADKCALALNRSPAAITAKAMKLNLRPQGEFKEAELKQVKSYGKVLGTAMMFIIPYRTSYEIKEMMTCVTK